MRDVLIVRCVTEPTGRQGPSARICTYDRVSVPMIMRDSKGGWLKMKSGRLCLPFLELGQVLRMLVSEGLRVHVKVQMHGVSCLWEVFVVELKRRFQKFLNPNIHRFRTGMRSCKVEQASVESRR